jgi:hypothetical protein
MARLARSGGAHLRLAMRAEKTITSVRPCVTRDLLDRRTRKSDPTRANRPLLHGRERPSKRALAHVERLHATPVNSALPGAGAPLRLGRVL